MNIKILNQSENKVEFSLEGINHVIANTLRRLVINEVPTLAIEEVDMKENSSAMYDEMLAHRLGLVPLTTDLKSYDMKQNCKCEGKGCASCTLKLKLQAKGPCIVYSGDIKSSDPKVKPVFDKMPLVKLLKDQEVELEATAVLGNGNMHAKFQPGLIFFKGYPQFTIKGGNEELARTCPVNILEFDGKKVKVTDETKCTLCMACQDHDSEAIQVRGSDKDFIFTLESWGQLDCKEILLKAMDMFDSYLNEFEKQLKKLNF
ncbi:MAG TPA: DNA-directed RNA polymerase subunit D [Candidatus Nanoarchaeia archaeon]|nr:DNA-directed RNA polymerase subunit D [Candidatus Nanoarchaeia archaeon]